jgi:hypothetical protein
MAACGLGRTPNGKIAKHPCLGCDCVRGGGAVFAQAAAWGGDGRAALLNDSYLVDPASSICLFQRLSHACLSISELIQ